MDNLVNNIHIKIFSQPDKNGEYSIIKYSNGNIINQYKVSEQHLKQLLESCLVIDLCQSKKIEMKFYRRFEFH